MKYNKINSLNLHLSYLVILFIIFFFPLILVLRSATINIATITISFLLIVFFFKNIKDFFSGNKLAIYLITFFFYILINTLIHNQDAVLTLKSLANYRYIILAIAVYVILDLSSEKFKYIFFYFNFFLIILIGLDIVYQYISGVNIFGFKPGFCGELGKKCQRFSGVFGEELIAGGYLSQVGLLVFFLLQKKKNEKKNINIIINYFFIIFLYLIILLTGERNALLIFLLSYGFFLFFQKKFLNMILMLLIFILLAFAFSYKIDSVKSRFFNPVDTWGDIYFEKKSTTIEKISNNPWFLHYQAALELFVESPMAGHGSKSFRVLCKDTKISKKLIENQSRYHACSTHPHNYLLEFLSEHGLIGGILFVILIIAVVVKIFRIRNYFTREAIVAIGLGSLLLAIMFPLKPSGSFFSTFNASMLFYIMGFFLYYSQKVK